MVRGGERPLVHSEIADVPAGRLEQERELLRPLPGLRPPVVAGAERKVDRPSSVRFGSARYRPDPTVSPVGGPGSLSDGRPEMTWIGSSSHRSGEISQSYPEGASKGQSS